MTTKFQRSVDRIGALIDKGYTIEFSDNCSVLLEDKYAECKMCGETTDSQNGSFAVTTDHNEKTATPWVICNRCAEAEDEA